MDAANDWRELGQVVQAAVEMYVRPKAPYGHSNLFVAGVINFTVNINSDGTIEFGIGNGNNGSMMRVIVAEHLPERGSRRDSCVQRGSNAGRGSRAILPVIAETT